MDKGGKGDAEFFMVVIYRRYIRFDSWRNFRKGSPGRCVSGNIIIGFLGSWLGEFLLGPLGPELGGFYLIPALLGAIFCLALYSFVARRIRERPKKE